MYKISEILSKPVISLYEGAVEGIIKNFTFDKKLKKITHFIVFDAEENADDQVITSNNIFAIGENALVIKNATCLEPLTNFEPQLKINNPINLQVYTTQGKCIGKVTDVIIEKNFAVKSFLISNDKEIDIKEIISLSKNAILVQDENVKINRTKLTNHKRPKLIKTDSPITILRNDSLAPILPQIPNTPTTLPTKVTSSVNFLVGRVVTQNLYSQSKELIAKKGSLISQKTIDNARKNGKIKELSIFSA